MEKKKKKNKQGIWIKTYSNYSKISNKNEQLVSH